jgi:hypothetical protein
LVTRRTGDSFDEPGGLRLVGEQRGAVGRSAHGIPRQAAALRHPVEDLLPGRLGEPVDRLPMRIGERLLRHPVARALVLVALPDERLDAEVVEHTAQERDLGADTEQVQLARRLEPHLAEAGGEVVRRRRVRRLAERVGPAHRRLAAGGEHGDGVPQLLRARQRHRAVAHLCDEPHHSRVATGLVQGTQHRPQPRLAAAANLGDRVVGLVLDEWLAEVELQQEWQLGAVQ